MEVHNHTTVITKRLWNVLRITFFMIRKGLISKRKSIVDLNLMTKKGILLKKSLTNFISHHQHSSGSKQVARGGIQEYYEFSCTSSPNPVFFHLPKRKHHYFPCINPSDVIEEAEDHQEHKAVVLLRKTPDYMFNFQIEAGEKCSPLLSPFSVRVSNYSSEDENDGRNRQEVDQEAEEFIKRFYEHLRAQSRVQLLQYQGD